MRCYQRYFCNCRLLVIFFCQFKRPCSTDRLSSSADQRYRYSLASVSYRANENAVKEYFSSFIEVQSVRLMKDRKTGKRKGYGFIEVVTDDLNSVIDKTNDSIFQERTLKVRPAKDKVEHA